VTDPSTAVEFDEHHLVELFDQAHALRQQIDEAAGRDVLQSQLQQVEQEIIGIVSSYFQRALRPAITKVFGRQVSSAAGDASLRYTAVINDFFVKVMETRPDAFWRAKTAKDLRTWSSVVVANQMRDYLRRKQKHREILAEIAPLVEQRQQHFRDRFGIEFDDSVLECLARWRIDSAAETSQMGWVLTHRYVDGMPYDDIAQQLNISKQSAYRLRERGIEILRHKFQGTGDVRDKGG
jgi:RNA polymerase sigma factor (sigma-70 family)